MGGCLQAELSKRKAELEAQLAQLTLALAAP